MRHAVALSVVWFAASRDATLAWYPDADYGSGSAPSLVMLLAKFVLPDLDIVLATIYSAFVHRDISLRVLVAPFVDNFSIVSATPLVNRFAFAWC